MRLPYLQRRQVLFQVERANQAYHSESANPHNPEPYLSMAFFSCSNDSLITRQTRVCVRTEHQHMMSAHFDLSSLLSFDSAEIGIYAPELDIVAAGCILPICLVKFPCIIFIMEGDTTLSYHPSFIIFCKDTFFRIIKHFKN